MAMNIICYDGLVMEFSLSNFLKEAGRLSCFKLFLFVCLFVLLLFILLMSSGGLYQV